MYDFLRSLFSFIGLNIFTNSVIASITLMTQHLKCFCSSLWFDRANRCYLLTSMQPLYSQREAEDLNVKGPLLTRKNFIISRIWSRQFTFVPFFWNLLWMIASGSWIMCHTVPRTFNLVPEIRPCHLLLTYLPLPWFHGSVPVYVFRFCQYWTQNIRTLVLFRRTQLLFNLRIQKYLM